jgi:hypothetical protein
LTRSHHFSPTEVDELPAIHIAGNDGVTFETCTAEVFRSLPELKSRSSQVFRETQGLRRPRFSFFIFTCQTARDLEVPTFLRGRVPTPLPAMNEPQSTYVDCCVTQQGEEHQWRVRSPWSVTRRRRAQWSGYRPPRSGLSTAIVNKSSHGGLSEKFPCFQRVREPVSGRTKAAR